MGIRRVGHLGTLDPLASGLLVLLVGSVTRLARLAQDWVKAYEGVVVFGRSTTTDDAQGEPTEVSDCWRELTRDRIRAEMTTGVGEILQRPPAYSAKKVGGRRAYARARGGEAVELAPVPVTVFGFADLAWEPPRLRFSCAISSGAYVRALARDLGAALRCPAHLEALRRTAVGPFQISEATALDEVTADRIMSPNRMAEGLPRRDLRDDDWEAFRSGRQIPSGDESGALVTLFREGELVGIAETQADRLQPRVVLGGS